MICILNSNFRKNYFSSSKNALDESLQLLKIGDNSNAVCIHSKPARKGHKYFVFADEKGYCSNLLLYLGTTITNKQAIETSVSSLPTYCVSKESLVTFLLIVRRIAKEIRCKIPLYLIQQIIKLQYCVTLDSGFATQESAHYFNSKVIGFVQVMRANKEFGLYFEEQAEFPLNKGEFSCCVLTGTDIKHGQRVLRNVGCMFMKSKRDLCITSNVYGSEPVSHKYTFLPKMNYMYNQTMNCVDKVDAKIGKPPHKNKSITVAIFRQLLHFAMSNAHVYWQVQTNETVEFREFLQQLVLQYLVETQKKGFPITSNSPSKRKMNQFLFTCDAHKLVSAQGKRGKCDGCGKTKNYAKVICRDCSTATNLIFVHENCLALHMDKVKAKKIKTK